MNAVFWWFLLWLGCRTSPPSSHGHAHGGGGGDDHPSGEDAGEAPTIAVTRWTDSHELFVELDAPAAGSAFAYHAHVTRLADNHAALSGELELRFEQDGFVVESHRDPGVSRPGIFAGEGAAPRTPGRYRLLFVYADGDERVEWDAGEVEVGAGAGVLHAEEATGEIAFLKESQWQIPFRVSPAREAPLSSVLSAVGVVQAAPESTAFVAAPVEGLVVWAATIPVIGRPVVRGERLGTLIPAGAAAHWASLQSELSTARIDRDLAESDLGRLEGLSGEDWVSARRLDEVRAARDRALSRLQAAERRISAITSGGAGAVPLRAPADGLVLEVGARHGEVISAGTVLVQVQTDPALLIAAQVHARHAEGLQPVSALSVMRGDWSAPLDLLPLGGEVLTAQLVYGDRTLSAPLSIRVPGQTALVPGDLVEVSVGVGLTTPRLIVPRGAVVEINGQDVVFVQETGESFSRRRVSLGTHSATRVEVRSGVALGEMVVEEGGFDVHVASLSGALESHRH